MTTAFDEINTATRSNKDLQDANVALQTENGKLKSVNSQQQDRIDSLSKSADAAQQIIDRITKAYDLWQGDEYAQIEEMFADNPIDTYFTKMDDALAPYTTLDMNSFNVIVSSAWEAEMNHCYELIESQRG